MTIWILCSKISCVNDSEDDFKGLFDDIDAFSDACEFLMGMYAPNAGKSGGEYYTPQEVSELLTRIT